MTIETIRSQASFLLQEGYDGILGLRKQWGHVGPYLFTNAAELQDLELEPRYPLANFIRQLRAKWPDKKFGAILRGCDERALKKLEERGVLSRNGLALIGVACSQEQAEICNCEKPIYDTHNCTGCWECVKKCEKEAIEVINPCPILVPKEFELGLAKRKAIYIPFPQAIPHAFLRDAEHCLKITGQLDCKGCERICEAGAIIHEMEEEYEEIEVGSIIVATGYDAFDPGVIPQYGYGKYDNVITALEFERLSSATGPTGGEILLKDGRKPESVAIIHCVGSRDQNYHEYCSRVCCMYALKDAHLIREKTGAEVYQMYIDMRCFGEGYEEFYKRLSEEGIHFIRGKAAKVTDQAMTEEEKGKLVVVCEDTLLGSMLRVPVDMVLLCTALEPRSDAEQVARLFNISRRQDGFFQETHLKLDPIATPTGGVFIAGCCQGPKDITDTVGQALAGAGEALALIGKGKVTLEAAIAESDETVCIGCGRCEEVCEYHAPAISKDGRVIPVCVVNEVLCKGCGACVVACPTGAMSIKHFTRDEILSMVDAFVEV